MLLRWKWDASRIVSRYTSSSSKVISLSAYKCSEQDKIYFEISTFYPCDAIMASCVSFTTLNTLSSSKHHSYGLPEVQGKSWTKMSVWPGLASHGRKQWQAKFRLYNVMSVCLVSHQNIWETSSLESPVKIAQSSRQTLTGRLSFSSFFWLDV